MNLLQTVHAPATNEEAIIYCENQTLSIVWLTNVVYFGDVQEIPQQMKHAIETRIAEKGLILNIVVMSHTPP